MNLRTGIAALTLVVAALSVESVAAASLGPSKLPSRVGQCFGYGYGAGHHAPIVKTPGQHPKHAPRYVHMPRHCGPLYPAPYAPVGCYGNACHGEPTPAAAPIVPTPTPEVLPDVAPLEDRHTWRFFEPVTPERQSPRNF
jgi:hypothetical protein